VVSGSLSISTEAGEVRLGPGQLHVVPKGVSHRPSSAEGADVLLFEPGSTVNTGDSPGPLTAPSD
jgi:mannose-6-phosphate isomerase-like protein (cupin superfamily)